MKARVPQTVIKPDYRQFRLRKLNTPEFSHIKLLLFWPVFGLAFLALERFRPHAAYHVMHCALDDAIPFSEWALIPYLLWFVYLIGALAYAFFQDVPAFRRMMRFVIVTYGRDRRLFHLPDAAAAAPRSVCTRQCAHAGGRVVLYL